jgi:hypothetical protein
MGDQRSYCPLYALFSDLKVFVISLNADEVSIQILASHAR